MIYKLSSPKMTFWVIFGHPDIMISFTNYINVVVSQYQQHNSISGINLQVLTCDESRKSQYKTLPYI